ncbi:MAG: DEAD/DEAH box helicase [Saprospiraceae bacterium]
MKQLANLFAYFKACYQSDNRETQIIDFLGNKVEKPLFLESAELLLGSLDAFPVHSEWAAETSKNLTLYSKEKELILGSFFLVGKLNNNKIQNICAPLLMNGVVLDYANELFTIALESDEHQLNPAIVTILQNEVNKSDGLYDILNETLPKDKFRFDELVQIEEIINRINKNVKHTYLQTFPTLFNEKNLVELYNKLTPADPLYLVPAIGVGVLKKSSLSRGVLNELAALSQVNQYGAPLKALFLQQNSFSKVNKKSIHYIPANLSIAQQKILNSIELNTSTLVIGPPGTGKSFTIAAIAIDALSKGKSILIAAKTDQAVDVIANKIENDFNIKDLIIRGGKKDYKRKLKNKIENLISGIHKPAPARSTLKDLETQIKHKLNKINRLEQFCKAREKIELERGIFLQKQRNKWYDGVKLWWIKKNQEQEQAYWALIEELENTIAEKNHLINEYILTKYEYELYHTLRNNRQEFLKLNSALRARTGGKKETLFQGIDFQVLYRVLPVWLVTAADVHNTLPLYKEMFDLVIIDEATQCDIASALPLLYRAKKVVVVGDPKQLRHVSFLSHKRQDYLVNKYGVNNFNQDITNYREHSLLDIISAALTNQDQVHFLDEHYRSLPDIISFSNRKFYNNALKIMTEAPLKNGEKNIDLLIFNGKRSKHGYNTTEADQVLSIVNEIITSESDLAPHYCQSIGILSPYREQVDYIRRKIEKQLSLEALQRHHLLIGTPYSFQGEERDIMILSLTIDADIHPSALQYLNKEDVLNVAVTRARNRQIVLISRKIHELSNNYLLTEYLHHIYANNHTNASIKPVHTDVFAQEVKDFLKRLNVTHIFEHYYLGGSTLDLVILHEHHTFAIDLVGYPGAHQFSFQTEKYKLLNRMGIRPIVIAYSSWVLQPTRVKEMLQHIITSI